MKWGSLRELSWEDCSVNTREGGRTETETTSSATWIYSRREGGTHDNRGAPGPGVLALCGIHPAEVMERGAGGVGARPAQPAQLPVTCGSSWGERCRRRN